MTKNKYITNLYYSYVSSLLIFICLFISVINSTKFCENATNLVYWYASAGSGN